jgi:hypothetical protein
VNKLPLSFIALALVAACSERPSPTAPPTASTVSASRSGAACAPHADFVVSDEPSLLAALGTAHRGQTIAIKGMVSLSTAIPEPGSEGLTITCATSGSGLSAQSGAGIPWLLAVFMRNTTVTNLVLDGANVTDGVVLASVGSDSAEGFVLAGNTISCGPALNWACVLLDGNVWAPDGSVTSIKNAQITDNQILANGTRVGLWVASYDGAIVARNRIVALVPTQDGLVIDHTVSLAVTANEITGPWGNAMWSFRSYSSVVQGNKLLGGVGGDAFDLVDSHGLQFIHNTVQCDQGCLFADAADGYVVSGNEMTSAGSSLGIHLQGNTNGARIEHNTITTSAFSADNFFGAIRVRDGAGVVIADNAVNGPWSNSLAMVGLTGSRIEQNRMRGATDYGIKARFGGCADGSAVCFTGNLIRENQIRDAGSAGILLQFACGNTLVNNDLRGNAGNVGIIFAATTGANTFRGDDDYSFQVLDSGAYDCTGDGINDPNRIFGRNGISRSVVTGSATTARVSQAPAAETAPLIVRHGVVVQ